MKKWKDMYKSWFEFGEKYKDSAIILRHEDILKDYKKELGKINRKFNLKCHMRIILQPHKQ